jgi:antirestriction protein
LHGRWINASQDEDDLAADVQAMLAGSPTADAEEFAIHDHEGFGGLELHEYEGLGTVARVASLIEEHGEVFGALASYFGDLEEAEAAMSDRYQGAWDSLEDWAHNLLQEIGELDGIPERLRCYFDVAAYARDIELSGDVITVDVEGSTHVFWAH